MSMRALLRDALVNDAAIRLLLGLAADDEAGAQAAVYAGNADSAQQRPFIVLKWQETTPGIPGNAAVGGRPLIVWAHDRPDDYGVIDSILTRARLVLTDPALVGVEAPDGSGGWSIDVRWDGDSIDGFDPERGTVWRNARFTVTGSGL